MRHTSKYLEGYRYYVYLGPGYIRYFETLEEAQKFQTENGGNIGEVD